jgi:hypothetical protein
MYFDPKPRDDKSTEEERKAQMTSDEFQHEFEGTVLVYPSKKFAVIANSQATSRPQQ